MQSIKSTKILLSSVMLALNLNASNTTGYASEDNYVGYGESSYEEQFQLASLAGITLGEDISTACPKFEKILNENKIKLDKKDGKCSTFFMMNGGLVFDNNKVMGIIIPNTFLGFKFLTPAEDVANSYINSDKAINADFVIKTERTKSGKIEKTIIGTDKNNQKIEINNAFVALQKLEKGRF